MNGIRHVALRYRLLLLFTICGFAALPARLSAGLPQCDQGCQAAGFEYCGGSCDRYCSGGACVYSCGGCS